MYNLLILAAIATLNPSIDKPGTTHSASIAPNASIGSNSMTAGSSTASVTSNSKPSTSVSSIELQQQPSSPNDIVSSGTQEDLERQKLILEVQSLRQWWRQPAYFQGLIALLAILGTLLSVWLGGRISYNNSIAVSQRQRKNEMMATSYAKLMGLKVPWTQAFRTTLEAKLLCEYYDALFHLTGDKEHLDEAKRQNARSLELIPGTIDFQREVFEQLGNVLIAYKKTEALDTSVRAIYHYRMIVIPERRGTFKSVQELDEWKNTVAKEIEDFTTSEYNGKLSTLLFEMERQLGMIK